MKEKSITLSCITLFLNVSLRFLYPLQRHYLGQNNTRFWHSRIILSEKESRDRGGNLRDREEGDKENVGKRGKRGENRDRSDRVVYSIVAGSRKEQQIQWLYRPSPV